ncbi:ANTAR domain-containing protein [Intrasporangium sp. YIM S08009]|uniref:ANTAR domain-containing protein n=1 Tax=Intrasporangium zincisolvens TaxID=3080018 RepID=UPI002B05B63B|nr:ANTAR domain-containing protein [Intrasporangium sp. YIM S08009]
MGPQTSDSEEELHRLEQLEEQVEVNRADLDALLAKNDSDDRRADASEARADETRLRVDEDRRRLADLEVRVDVDRELILELQGEGVLSREQVAQLEEALRTSRQIGAAIGIVMANRRVDEQGAFDVLRKASSLTNRKLRLVAEDVVLTGAVDNLPVL